jgi:hypothetical protein
VPLLHNPSNRPLLFPQHSQRSQGRNRQNLQELSRVERAIPTSCYSYCKNLVPMSRGNDPVRSLQSIRPERLISVIIIVIKYHTERQSYRPSGLTGHSRISQLIFSGRFTGHGQLRTPLHLRSSAIFKSLTFLGY